MALVALFHQPGGLDLMWLCHLDSLVLLGLDGFP